MASSLRRQVDALRHSSSGTSSGYIQRKKGKPSLLLTPDQAADVDLSSVRETAVLGLQRLEAVDKDFSPFQATLFSKEAEGTLRDLQTKKANDRIDKSISAFLALLSPHFSSREAHFCLEYLIRHYKVYQYNVDAIVECCLPWHDTLAFARMVQLLSLKGSRWEFLTPVQKTGTPLPREVIARRCARDFGLLRFLCISARSSASKSSVSAATAAGRATLFSFYAAVVVEALASLGSASEALLRALVPTVVHGLSATKSPEYQMASYMILSALSGKGPLSPEVTSTALTSLVCKPCQGGFEPSLLCALAVAQSQVGFYSNKSSLTPGAPLLLPTLAFEKLSEMECLPTILARLAQKFDTSAFLWLLLQSYVGHLSDGDGEHGKSLTRLCTYPHWPSHSLPRLVRRLVDRLIRSFLATAIGGSGDVDGMEVENTPEVNRRAADRKRESQRVLRVLGQRFPQEVDAAVGKISRSVAKTKGATAKAAPQGESDDEDENVAKKSEQEAAQREEALSCLLVSTFAGAELAQRMPLENHQGNDDETFSEIPSAIVVHGSLMVALEHSSGVVRARAVKQLARVLSSAEADDTGSSSPSAAAASGCEDLSPALLRRLHDEDPDVVLAITDSDGLMRQVLLRSPSVGAGADGDGDDQVVDVLDAVSFETRAAAVATAIATAAAPWLSALSEPRPKHPVASSGRVVCGLVNFMSAAAAAPNVGASQGVLESSLAMQSMDSALLLFLECLPGPHATSRVKLAQHNASASYLNSGSGVADNDGAAAAAAAGKACKKALQVVGRVAIEAVSKLCRSAADRGILEIFAGLGKVLSEAQEKRKVSAKSTSKKSKKSALGEGDAMEVEESGKSKGLKSIGEEVCDSIAVALVKGGEVKALQALGETAGPGGRWLVMESISRAVSLAAASSGSGSSLPRAAPKAAAFKLAALLASLTMSEVRLRPNAFSMEICEAGNACGVGASGLLRYLRICAAHLPLPERPSSLYAEDHLTPSVNDDAPTAGQGNVAAADPLLGDVLVSILKASSAVPEGTGSGAVWEAVSAVVLHGYERRPLCALAAIAVDGVSSSLVLARQGLRSSRQQRRDCSAVADGKVVAAARALSVAATFVRATAEALSAKKTIGDNDQSATAERELVAVFPAAVLAVASDDKGLRDGGILFISAVAAHGDALFGGPSIGSPSKQHGKKSKSASTAAFDAKAFDVFLPSLSRQQKDGGNAVEPSPLQAPALSSVVELATALVERNRESTLDAGELTRHLAMRSGGDVGTVGHDVVRYLVAWAARLGWRNHSASACLLECLVWAKTPMRECCLPLLRFLLGSHQALNDADSVRLLKLLLDVTLDSPAIDNATEAAGRIENSNGKIPKRATPGSKDKDTASSAADPVLTSVRVFKSAQAEELMHRALRTAGHTQTYALNSLASTTTPSGNVGAAAVTGKDFARQRRDLVVTLVEVGLAGADASLVAEVARAILVQPYDLATLLGGLLSKATNKHPAGTSRPASSTKSGWVFTFAGIVELAQALCGPPPVSADQPSQTGQSSRGNGGVEVGTASSAQGWEWAAPLALARPLFDVLPALLAVAKTAQVEGFTSSGSSSATGIASDVDAAEYALWLTMDVLGTALRRWGKGGVAAEKLYERSCAGDDSEMVLACVKENPSPQTRNSGLALLSRMTTLFPAQMASRLPTLLNAVCAAAAGREGFSGTSCGAGGGGARAALRQTQKAVQSIVPALRAHGAEAGVGAHFVVQVFVDALDNAPVHARRALFSTLIDSLGEESRAIITALLLRRAVSSSGLGGVGPEASSVNDTTALVEFVHQTLHCSRAEAQVRTLVGLVQACHRLSVNSAERSGDLHGHPLEDAVESFGQDLPSERDKLDYLKLPLKRKSTGGDNNASEFMTMDLQALSVDTGDDGTKDVDEVMGKFLTGLLTFVRDHLMSRPLFMAVAAAAERSADGKGEDEGIQEGFLLLCEDLLLLLRTLAAIDRSTPSGGGGSPGPSWSTLQGLAYAVFETLQSLLSVPFFVVVTQELLQHQDPHLRRKALQMFTRRLDHEGGALRLTPGEERLFVDMVPSLRSLAMGKKATGESWTAEEYSSKDGGLEEVMGRSSGAMDEDDGEDDMTESAVNRQTALLSLDVLARVTGRRHKGVFVGVLDDVTEIVAGKGSGALPAVRESGADGILPLRASAFVLVATLCAVLSVQAFPRLPRFFPAMLQALETQTRTADSSGKGQNLLRTSALSAVATVAASLPSFLNPYLKRILAAALRSAAPEGSASAATTAGKQAADRVLSLLAAGVEPRLLVPAVCGAYAGCAESAKVDESAGVVVAARSVARLLAYVQEIVAGLEKDAASAALPQLTRLVTQALDFRRQHASGSLPELRSSAELVETEASSALVCLVMRLSEVELRPLFLHLCEWKAGVPAGDKRDAKAILGGLDRRLSFYRILDGLAGALKSIFTPYFAHVLTDCCDDMESASRLATSAANGSSTDEKKRKRGQKEVANKRKRRKTLSSDDLADDGRLGDEEADDESDTPELRWRLSAASRLVLSAFHRCFQSDRSGFVNKARFDLLLPAVVAQLECGSDYFAAASCEAAAAEDQDEVSSCRLHAEELVGPCLAQLASASGKDALWKAIANAVLMRTRSKRAGVRVAALVSLRQCFQVVGEEFLALLPECLPFLSELLEDGHPEVESECRSLVKYIEGVLGESIESYLV